MPKKLPHTPRSKIKQYLRMCWLRSRERAKVLKDANYTCKCGKKQSRAKGKEVYVEVHHKNEINWEELIDMVFDKLLNPEQECICKPCHRKETEKQRSQSRSKPSAKS